MTKPNTNGKNNDDFLVLIRLDAQRLNACPPPENVIKLATMPTSIKNKTIYNSQLFNANRASAMACPTPENVGESTASKENNNPAIVWNMPASACPICWSNTIKAPTKIAIPREINTFRVNITSVNARIGGNSDHHPNACSKKTSPLTWLFALLKKTMMEISIIVPYNKQSHP